MNQDLPIVERRPQKQSFTFKGKTRLSKPKFLQKAAGHRITIEDSKYRHFCTSLSVFMPKLDPQHIETCTMLHIVNGNGSCFLRVKNSKILVAILQDLIDKMQQESWLDIEWRLEDQSTKIVNNEGWILEEQIMDINAWNSALEGTVDIKLVEEKQGGEK